MVTELLGMALMNSVIHDFDRPDEHSELCRNSGCRNSNYSQQSNLDLCKVSLGFLKRRRFTNQFFKISDFQTGQALSVNSSR